jgi:hypothetical protein
VPKNCDILPFARSGKNKNWEYNGKNVFMIDRGLKTDGCLDLEG